MLEFESNILDLDLKEGSLKPNIYDPEWDINNTIRGWTRLHERISKLLRAPLSIRNIRQLLYSTGYGLTEIAEVERPMVSREAIGQFVRGVKRPPVINTLRNIFHSKGGGLEMDQVIDVLGSFINGSTPGEVITMLGRKDVEVMRRKQLELREAGFPIEMPLKEDILGLRRLTNSEEWESLEVIVREVRGKRLPTLDLLYQTLEENGFTPKVKQHGHLTYYFFPVSEKEKLLQLNKEHPEVFKSRTWKRYNPRLKSQKSTSSV